jgi:hypothetical protein
MGEDFTMIKDHKRNLTSNCFGGSMLPLIGETIKGVYHYTDDHDFYHNVIVFESGYSLELLHNGSYWIESPEDTIFKIRNNFGKLKELKESLQYLADLTGELL